MNSNHSEEVNGDMRKRSDYKQLNQIVNDYVQAIARTALTAKVLKRRTVPPLLSYLPWPFAQELKGQHSHKELSTEIIRRPCLIERSKSRPDAGKLSLSPRLYFAKLFLEA